MELLIRLKLTLHSTCNCRNSQRMRSMIGGFTRKVKKSSASCKVGIGSVKKDFLD